MCMNEYIFWLAVNVEFFYFLNCSNLFLFQDLQARALEHNEVLSFRVPPLFLVFEQAFSLVELPI